MYIYIYIYIYNAVQAPEMLRDEPISEKVDQYGMGIMLWEMYTGQLPWSDKNVRPRPQCKPSAGALACNP